jgi:hypothetical protein
MMKKKDLRDAIVFLRRLFVGVSETDRLCEVIESLERELRKRHNDERTDG